MKAKNKDGTWNVLDENYISGYEIFGWRQVPDTWLDSINRKGILKIVFREGQLFVTYKKRKKIATYGHNLVYGVWDAGIRFS